MQLPSASAPCQHLSTPSSWSMCRDVLSEVTAELFPDLSYEGASLYVLAVCDLLDAAVDICNAALGWGNNPNRGERRADAVFGRVCVI